MLSLSRALEISKQLFYRYPWKSWLYAVGHDDLKDQNQQLPFWQFAYQLKEMESLWCMANNFSDLTDYYDDRVRKKREKLFAAPWRHPLYQLF